jgi:hypothetical protein
MGLPLLIELPLGYVGMVVSIGIRQLAHVRRFPSDLRRLPLFVLQVTFVMVPIRIAAFATMFHQGWSTRGAAGLDGALRVIDGGELHVPVEQALTGRTPAVADQAQRRAV